MLIQKISEPISEEEANQKAEAAAKAQQLFAQAIAANGLFSLFFYIYYYYL